MTQTWRARAESELKLAEEAHARSNAGMARVCARRAAGWAVEAYLHQSGINLQNPSVLDQMRHLLTMEGTSLRQREILQHLLIPKLKGNLNEDSYFPLDVDLVAEARELIETLFPESHS